jgi:hypothetical protein
LKVTSSALILAAVGLLVGPAPGQRLRSRSDGISNAWNSITPLRSSANDVARLFAMDTSQNPDTSGPFKVDGGDVTFSFLTDSLARIYHAPQTMVGKVFTIYFKPNVPMAQSEVKLVGFKKCVDQSDRRYYYFVSEAGLGYQVSRKTDQIEMVIHQPSAAEIKRLRVSTACVF